MTRKTAKAAAPKAAPAKAKTAKAAAPAAEAPDKAPAKPVVPARPVPAHKQFLSKGAKPQSMGKGRIFRHQGR
jgi:hypothetical protein